MPRTTIWSATLVLLIASNEFTRAANQGANPDPLEVVRVADPELRRLMLEGHARSATFRLLVEAIRQSGWLVFVQAGRCAEKATVACLWHFVGAYEGARYMRVLVTPQGRHPDNVIATLAHELQHAWEVAQDSRVRDARAMRVVFSGLARSA